jgi:glycosyltransferase involved in cell wall biosynthesis
MISIIIPAYNAEKTICRCLDSALAQAAEAEIILADDGSTDATLRLAERYEDQIRVLRLAHGGVSAARNAALDMAKGRLVFFVDPDDTVHGDYFSAMTAALDRDGADVCVCAYEGSPLKGDYRFRTNAEIRAG